MIRSEREKLASFRQSPNQGTTMSFSMCCANNNSETIACGGSPYNSVSLDNSTSRYRMRLGFVGILILSPLTHPTSNQLEVKRLKLHHIIKLYQMTTGEKVIEIL